MYFDNPPGGEHPVKRTEAHIHALYLKFFHCVRNIRQPGEICREVLITLQGLFGADGAVFCYIHDEGAQFLAAIGTLSHMQNALFDVNSPKIAQFLENRRARVFTREALKDYIAMAMNARFESAVISPITIDEHPYGLLALVANRENYFQEEDACTLYNASLYISTLLKARSHELSQHELNYLDRLGLTSQLVSQNLTHTLNTLEQMHIEPEIFQTLLGHLDNLNILADLTKSKDFSQTVNIHQALREIMDSFKPESIEVNLSCANQIPCVRGNEEIIRRIIRELLNNAAQALFFSPRPDARIQVQIYTLPGFVVIEVANTGDPIAPADERRLFEPIFSLWPGHKGLGLTCARFYALKMGGNIVYRACHDQMVGFRFIIPDEQHAPQIEIF